MNPKLTNTGLNLPKSQITFNEKSGKSSPRDLHIMTLPVNTYDDMQLS
jgi:hypothetical protein